MLKQRALTALILFALALALVFYAPELLWQGVIVAIASIAAWEWSQFIGKSSLAFKLFYSLVLTGLVVVGLMYPYTELLKLLIVLQLAVVLLAVIGYQKSEGQATIPPLLVALLGAVFIVAFSWSMIWLRESISAFWLLFSLAVVWIMDTGAYFAGRRFGRHKLARFVSPGKTWEGVLGGMVLVALVSLLVGLMMDSSSPGLVVFVLAAALIAGLSVFGDLFESLLKRQVGLKDSGQILPGHGGVLDRIDSLLLAIPLFWLFWSLV